MLVILVKYASSDPQSLTSRVHLLNRILSTLIRVLTNDYEARRGQTGAAGTPSAPFDEKEFIVRLGDDSAVKVDSAVETCMYVGDHHGLRMEAAVGDEDAQVEEAVQLGRGAAEHLAGRQRLGPQRQSPRRVRKARWWAGWPLCVA